MKVLGIGNAIIDVICKVEENFITENNLTKGTMKLFFDEIEFKDLLGSSTAAIVTLRRSNSSGSNGFFFGLVLALCKFIHRIMRYASEISAMEAVDSEGRSIHLAWAVLSQNTTTGRSEVVKITSHEEADDFVQNNPSVYYKSGPFVV